jgi:hypothetical protein
MALLPDAVFGVTWLVVVLCVVSVGSGHVLVLVHDSVYRYFYYTLRYTEYTPWAARNFFVSGTLILASPRNILRSGKGTLKSSSKCSKFFRIKCCGVRALGLLHPPVPVRQNPPSPKKVHEGEKGPESGNNHEGEYFNGNVLFVV